ncbi:hypothetical protein NX059_004438 [Plenodomus lindquistii]|nr:hypothetical protein NX059_004438 [Plenodomus lindquistii]
MAISTLQKHEPFRGIKMQEAFEHRTWTRIPHLLPAVKEVGSEILSHEKQGLRKFGDEFVKCLTGLKDEASPLVAIDTDKGVQIVQMDAIAHSFL